MAASDRHRSARRTLVRLPLLRPKQVRYTGDYFDFIVITVSCEWCACLFIDILSTAAKEHSVWRKNIDWDCRNWSMFSWREQVGHDLVEYPACHWPFRMQEHRRSRCMDHRNLVNCSVRCEDSLCCGRYRYSGQPAMPANATRITCWRWPTYRWQSM